MWWTNPRNLEEKKGREGFDILRWKRKVPIVPTRRWCGDVFDSRYVPISSVCLVPFRHFLPDFLPFLTARYFKDAMLSGRKRLEVRGQCAAAEERCVAYQLIPGAVQESWREGKNKKCSRTNIEGGWRRTRCRCFQWGCLTSFSTSAPSGLPCLWHVRMKKWLRAAKEKKKRWSFRRGVGLFRLQSIAFPAVTAPPTSFFLKVVDQGLSINVTDLHVRFALASCMATVRSHTSVVRFKIMGKGRKRLFAC